MTIQTITDNSLEIACRALTAGKLVGMPTETVYGLAADATSDKAVAAIYEAKGRPSINPLIAHVGDISQVYQHGLIGEAAEKLAQEFWPGPITMVLRRVESCSVSHLATAGLDTIAVRVPAHQGARELLKAFGKPIVAPSANITNTISPTSAQHVADGLAQAVELILDGGDCKVGLESTIIDLTCDKPKILRPGGIAREEIEAIIGPVEVAKADEAIKAPGMMKRHYAPGTAIRLNASERKTGEVYLGFGQTVQSDINLSEDACTKEAAANLFKMLRRLDKEGADTIAIAPIPEEGLGLAINDRLRRAAAPES